MKNTNKSDAYRSVGINNIKAPVTQKPVTSSSVISNGTDLRAKGGKKK